jgi:hypothetical protein
MNQLSARNVMEIVIGGGEFSPVLAKMTEDILQTNLFGEVIGLGLMMMGGRKPLTPIMWETCGTRVKRHSLQLPATFDQGVLPFLEGNLRFYEAEQRACKTSSDTKLVYLALIARVCVEAGLQFLELRGPCTKYRTILQEIDNKFARDRVSREYFAKDCALGVHDLSILRAFKELDLGDDSWWGSLIQDVCPRERKSA